MGARRRRPPATDSDQSAQQRRQVHATRRPRRAAGDGTAGAAVIRVSDNGAGIPSQMLDSVFDLFVQGRHTLDHADGGLGVGLTLVRALVEMHGGTVTAHSDGDGKGSEFTVRLPLTSRPEQPAHPRTGQLPGITIRGQRRRRGGQCRQPGDALLDAEAAGLHCHGAPTVRALALIDEVSPDVVILDVGLPDWTGSRSRAAFAPIHAMPACG